MNGLRAVAVWLMIVVAESISGTIRRIWLAPALGDLKSHQIGVLTGSVLILLIAWLTARWLDAPTFKAQLQTGLLWMLLNRLAVDVADVVFRVRCRVCDWQFNAKNAHRIRSIAGTVDGFGLSSVVVCTRVGGKDDSHTQTAVEKLIMQIKSDG